MENVLNIINILTSTENTQCYGNLPTLVPARWFSG